MSIEVSKIRWQSNFHFLAKPLFMANALLISRLLGFSAKRVMIHPLFRHLQLGDSSWNSL